MVAGSREEAPHIVEDVIAPGGGDCLVIGGSRRAGPLDAALINGTAAHVLDFDNTAAHMGGHVSAVMVPALLAAAEAFDCNGRDLLLGHVVGYEVGAPLVERMQVATDGSWVITAATSDRVEIRVVSGGSLSPNRSVS